MAPASPSRLAGGKGVRPDVAGPHLGAIEQALALSHRSMWDEDSP
jgi:hypothetical protein